MENAPKSKVEGEELLNSFPHMEAAIQKAFPGMPTGGSVGDDTAYMNQHAETDEQKEVLYAFGLSSEVYASMDEDPDGALESQREANQIFETVAGEG